jgi:hypothetical protein
MDDETFEEDEKSYQFFLAELKGISTDDLSIMVELMRCAHHIKDIQKLMSAQAPEGLNEAEELQYWVEQDSLIIMILNISAAQLKEALKLFGRFSRTIAYSELVPRLSEKQRTVVENLVQLDEEYPTHKGFIRETLDPVRHAMFHYAPDQAKAWVERQKTIEAEEKPPYQSVSIQVQDFSPGREHDGYIYHQHIFFGPDGLESLMKAQQRIWELQIALLESIAAITEALMEKENIPKREHGWFMAFAHGYK